MLQGLLRVLAVCIDAYFAAFSYGSSKIKLTFVSAFIVSLIGAAALMISIFFSDVIGEIIPQTAGNIIGFITLLLLGLVTLFKDIIKNVVNRSENGKRICFKYGGVGLVVEICIDGLKADMDNSKVITYNEAITLGIALSLDSLVSGVGAGFLGVNMWFVAFSALIFCMIALMSGYFTGKLLSSKTTKDRSWISGVILIVIAVLKVI